MLSWSGRAWAAASTEGLLIYSLDAGVVFDPLELDVDVTPARVRTLLGKGDLLHAMVMSLRLNEIAVIQETVESVPVAEGRSFVFALFVSKKLNNLPSF